MAARRDKRARQVRRIESKALPSYTGRRHTILALFVSSLGRSVVTETGSAVLEGQTPELGRLLFERYLLPFEIVGVLLLVAMVGVVLLSKKDLK